ncbi:MAG: hypothetical protein IJA34_03860 [Lachnospiraceae bacterium]|nr:hypothetical protein [Lachnospiraceae bacterium]
MTKGLKKRIFSIILTIVMMVGLLPTNLVVSFASETESEEIVIEVTNWDEFKNAFHYSEYKGDSFTIKLMNDLCADTAEAGEKKTAILYTWIYGSFVTLDFNGYTLSFNEECSANDLAYKISDFITIKMRPLNYTVGSTLRIIDSKGGGGISMNSVRAYDSQLSALHILGDDYFELNGILKETVGPINKVIIDGGEYTLNAKIHRVGNGTLDGKTYYRGTVIADWVKAEINDGVFKAESDGVYTSDGDMCARELSAFATCCSTSARPNDVKYGKVIINGGLFMSDGYSIHHFDNASKIDETYYMNFPKIKAGAFIGKMGFLGKTYTYSEGYDYWVAQPASNVISSESFVRGINKNQEYFNDIVGMTLKDLHELKSCYVFNEKVFDLKTTPIIDEDTVLERCSEQSEEFSITYSIPMWVEKLDTEYYTEISVIGENKELNEKTDTLNVSYKDFVGEVKVILDFYYIIGKEPISFSKEYDVLVSEIQKGAEITVQPKSSQVLPGEFASAYVVADYAKSYQWYYIYEGYKFEITEDFLSMFDGVIMEGYDTPCLSVKFSEDYVGEEIFYCVITGLDGSKVNTNRITLTFGDKPTVNSFAGGEYNNTTDAVFTIWGYYMENVTWNVMYKTSGNMTIYTLDEFAKLVGVDYTVKHQKFANHLYRAMVTFKNVPESVNKNYSVGYSLKNNLGTVDFIPDNTLLFEFIEVKPEITQVLESQSCFSGENVTYSFVANNMVASEWRFEKEDEEGVMVVYTIDEMKELYDDMTFEETFSDGEASLTITNVQCELNDYILYGYAIGENGIASAGKVFMNVGDIEVFDEIKSGWDNKDGNWYFYDSDGNKVTGWKKINKYYYYFDANGIMQSSKWISGKYYVKENGQMAVSEFVDGGKYYVDENGLWVKETKWMQVGDNWYFLNAGTVQISKWAKIGGKYYYFDANGVMQSSKWIGNYYVKANGVMAVSEFVDGGKYYVNENGLWVKETKWMQIDGNWYYILSGTVQVSKWTKIGSKYYYFDANGVMQSSKWIGNYYVKADGSMAVSQWVEGKYYVKADGTMAKSEWVDNGKYYVGEDGVWVPNP